VGPGLGVAVHRRAAFEVLAQVLVPVVDDEGLDEQRRVSHVVEQSPPGGTRSPARAADVAHGSHQGVGVLRRHRPLREHQHRQAVFTFG
jgi:hypothetical protein